MPDHPPSRADDPSEWPGGHAPPSEEITGFSAEEVVDAAPVQVSVRALSGLRSQPPSSVRTAAAAAGGFLAGAATFALLHRRDARRLARAMQRPLVGPGAPLLPTSGSRRYLVDVHVIAKREE